VAAAVRTQADKVKAVLAAAVTEILVRLVLGLMVQQTLAAVAVAAPLKLAATAVLVLSLFDTFQCNLGETNGTLCKST
jgi:hypothetical protein